MLTCRWRQTFHAPQQQPGGGGGRPPLGETIQATSPPAARADGEVLSMYYYHQSFVSPSTQSRSRVEIMSTTALDIICKLRITLRCPKTMACSSSFPSDTRSAAPSWLAVVKEVGLVGELDIIFIINNRSRLRRGKIASTAPDSGASTTTTIDNCTRIASRRLYHRQACALSNALDTRSAAPSRGCSWSSICWFGVSTEIESNFSVPCAVIGIGGGNVITRNSNVEF
jgi:hypothetical protein